MTSRLQLHVARWRGCQRCESAATRRRVVHVRGSVPCDVLFLGEAPGESEDVLGMPFVGPAGKLLDRIIVASGVTDGPPPRSLAFINMAGCIPRDPDGGKGTEPSADCIEACAPRVTELLELCRPKLLVTVGRIADDWVDLPLKGYSGREQIRVGNGYGRCHLVHPAAILKANVAQRDFLIQRNVVVLRNAVEELERGK